MELSCLHMSGARRSCAAVAIRNGLHAAHLLAVAAPLDLQGRLAETLASGLESTGETQVLCVAEGDAPWLSTGEFGLDLAALTQFLESSSGPGEPARYVLVWRGVDLYAARFPGRLEQVVRILGQLLAGEANHRLHRVILIGGTDLLDRTPLLDACTPAEVKVRSIVVV